MPGILERTRKAVARRRLQRAAQHVPADVYAAFYVAVRATSRDHQLGDAVNEHMLRTWPALSVWGVTLSRPEDADPVTAAVLEDADRVIDEPAPPESDAVAHCAHAWAAWGAYVARGLARGRLRGRAA